MNILALVKAIDLLMMTVELTAQGLQSWNEYRAELQVFVDEERDPTPKEFIKLNSSVDAKLLRIAKAD